MSNFYISECDPVHVQIDPGDETVACLREIVKYHCVTDGELLTWKVNGETVYSDVRSTIINGSLYIESFIEFPAIVDSEILCSGKTLDGRKQPGNQTVHLRVQGLCREGGERNRHAYIENILSLHDNPHKPGHRPPTQSEINVTLSYGGSDLYDVFP